MDVPKFPWSGPGWKILFEKSKKTAEF